MSQTEGESFTFKWQVKNFSMCPVNTDGYISSPVVKLNLFQNSEWRLKLYPKGERSYPDYISYFLECRNLGAYNNHVLVNFSLSIFPLDTGFIQKEFKLHQTFGYMVQLVDVFKEKDKFLPNDTLTLECTITCENKEYLVDMDRIEGSVLDNLTRENSLDVKKCSIETTVEVQRRSVVWPIRKIESLPVNKRLTLPVLSAMKNLPAFYVTFFTVKGTKSAAIIKIRKKKNGTSLPCDILVRCSVSVINSPQGVVTLRAEDEFLFWDNGCGREGCEEEGCLNNWWTFPTFIKLKELENEKYFEHTDGVLYLQFDFAFSISGQIHHSEIHSSDPTFLPFKNQIPLEEFRYLSLSSDDEENSMVSIRAGYQTFKAHRRILTAKSEVFKAMFDSDMKEKTTGVVDIGDVDPDTLGRMLVFFYSNAAAVPKLPIEDVMKLYAAADKYQVMSLLSDCSFILESMLSLSNVCEILSLADMLRDERLLKSAEDFIVADLDRILVSDDWKELMKTYPALTSNVMYKILVRR